jgi:hypothetical protein
MYPVAATEQEEDERNNGEEIMDGTGCRCEDHRWVHQSKLGCVSGHLAGRHDGEGVLSRCEATAIHVPRLTFLFADDVGGVIT